MDYNIKKAEAFQQRLKNCAYTAMRYFTDQNASYTLSFPQLNETVYQDPVQEENWQAMVDAWKIETKKGRMQKMRLLGDDPQETWIIPCVDDLLAMQVEIRDYLLSLRDTTTQ